MSQEIHKKIKNNPKYIELIKKRKTLVLSLSFILAGTYFLFIIILAFFPQFFAIKIVQTVVPIGIPIGISIILLSLILAKIYIQSAASKFDDLVGDIIEDSRLDS